MPEELTECSAGNMCSIFKKSEVHLQPDWLHFNVHSCQLIMMISWSTFGLVCKLVISSSAITWTRADLWDR